MHQPQLSWKLSYHLAMGIKTKLFQSARSYYISRQCAMYKLSLWSGKMNWLMILTRSIITIEKIITNMQVSIKSQHENSMAWIAIADFRCDVAAVYLYEIHTTRRYNSVFYFCESIFSRLHEIAISCSDEGFRSIIGSQWKKRRWNVKFRTFDFYFVTQNHWSRVNCRGK